MILDTNGLSALADGDPKLEPVLRRVSELALPVIVLGEYRYGISHSRKRAEYERWLAGAVARCRVLLIETETAEEYAAVRSDLQRVGHPIPANDAWIAALARQHGLPVLSRDAHFDFVPDLQRVEW